MHLVLLCTGVDGSALGSWSYEVLVHMYIVCTYVPGLLTLLLLLRNSGIPDYDYYSSLPHAERRAFMLVLLVGRVYLLCTSYVVRGTR